MNQLDKLISYFEKFPGVGARQARRFAFHLLTLPASDLTEISELVQGLKKSVKNCTSCWRFFTPHQPEHDLCEICSNTDRDHQRLLVVERDSDIKAIERSGVYDGLYFVLGGTIPLLDSKEHTRVRSEAFKQRIVTNSEILAEIVLAFAVNPDGENTTRFLRKLITESELSPKPKISILGRGLSTGSELEYADPETIKSAFSGRTTE